MLGEHSNVEMWPLVVSSRLSRTEGAKPGLLNFRTELFSMRKLIHRMNGQNQILHQSLPKTESLLGAANCQSDLLGGRCSTIDLKDKHEPCTEDNRVGSG